MPQHCRTRVLPTNPSVQVTALPTKYHRALAWAGRIGWVGKAVVYAMIGGLACQAAVSGDTPNPNLPQAEQISASPQVGGPQPVQCPCGLQGFLFWALDCSSCSPTCAHMPCGGACPEYSTIPPDQQDSWSGRCSCLASCAPAALQWR